MTDRNVYDTMDSPLGMLVITARHNAVTGVYTARHPLFKECQKYRGILPVLTAAINQLQDYFSGTRMVFDVPLNPVGTAFQRRVWTALTAIPYGQTNSYGAVANAIGAPKSARAVGMANSKNPISIMIPCHRVIGSGGNLTGYAGGIDAKKWLITHEKDKT